MSFALEQLQELDDEERVAGGLLKNETGQRRRIRGARLQGVADQLVQIGQAQRPQRNAI